jgi:hypothetical protein
MLERCSHRGKAGAAVRNGICDRFLFGLALLTLVRAGEAAASEQAAGATAARPETQVRTEVPAAASGFTGPLFMKQPYTPHLLSDPLLTAPGAYRLGNVPDARAFSEKDFRPRGRSMFDPDPRADGPEQGFAFNKNTWQRLNEYRTHDRVRVLTLWESGASAVSLQTDHKGDPSLQWTSRLMNRGGASHGLLDQLFPTSIFGGATRVTRSPTAQPSRISGALSTLHFGAAAPP